MGGLIGKQIRPASFDAYDKVESNVIDAQNVKIAGDQIIEGVKTFTSVIEADGNIKHSESSVNNIELDASGNSTFNGDMITKNGDSVEEGLIGVDQTLQDVTASRSGDITYTNSTGKPIVVYIAVLGTVTADSFVYLDGSIVLASTVSTTSRTYYTLIVPNGSTYSKSAANISITHWFEFR